MAAEMGAIKTIMKILKGFISPPIPNKPLPVPVVLAGGPLKPGLSAIDIASEEKRMRVFLLVHYLVVPII